jgi:hypothetical protein
VCAFCPVSNKYEFTQQLLVKKSPTSNFTKIKPAEAELFHAER